MSENSFISSIDYVKKSLIEGAVIEKFNDTVIESRYKHDNQKQYCYRCEHKKGNELEDGFFVLYAVNTLNNTKINFNDGNWTTNPIIESYVKISGSKNDGYIIEAKVHNDKKNHLYKMIKLYIMNKDGKYFMDAYAKENIPTDYIANIIKNNDYDSFFKTHLVEEKSKGIK